MRCPVCNQDVGSDRFCNNCGFVEPSTKYFINKYSFTQWCSYVERYKAHYINMQEGKELARKEANSEIGVIAASVSLSDTQSLIQKDRQKQTGRELKEAISNSSDDANNELKCTPVVSDSIESQKTTSDAKREGEEKPAKKAVEEVVATVVATLFEWGIIFLIILLAIKVYDRIFPDKTKELTSYNEGFFEVDYSLFGKTYKQISKLFNYELYPVENNDSLYSYYYGDYEIWLEFDKDELVAISIEDYTYGLEKNVSTYTNQYGEYSCIIVNQDSGERIGYSWFTENCVIWVWWDEAQQSCIIRLMQASVRYEEGIYFVNHYLFGKQNSKIGLLCDVNLDGSFDEAIIGYVSTADEYYDATYLDNKLGLFYESDCCIAIRVYDNKNDLKTLESAYEKAYGTYLGTYDAGGYYWMKDDVKISLRENLNDNSCVIDYELIPNNEYE